MSVKGEEYSLILLSDVLPSVSSSPRLLRSSTNTEMVSLVLSAASARGAISASISARESSSFCASSASPLLASTMMGAYCTIELTSLYRAVWLAPSWLCGTHCVAVSDSMKRVPNTPGWSGFSLNWGSLYGLKSSTSIWSASWNRAAPCPKWLRFRMMPYLSLGSRSRITKASISSDVFGGAALPSSTTASNSTQGLLTGSGSTISLGLGSTGSSSSAAGPSPPASPLPAPGAAANCSITAWAASSVTQK
mmetsp:Transcript_6843/g.15689  ORF Transcript_6843/g.15689 Transcript_6843/m.15689 type:complete len:250 (-) Transcript_6843:518-1267(-)